MSDFPASAMPFADQLDAATIDEDCPDEPSADFWTTTAPEWKQVPRNARHLLVKLRQYVMWLDYSRFKHQAMQILVELKPQSWLPQRSWALPFAPGVA